jgi:hypothetical protein
MPVKKKKKVKKVPEKKKLSLLDFFPISDYTNEKHPIFHVGGHARRIFVTLFGILLVYIIIWMATLIRNNIQAYDYIGEADRLERTIAITSSEKISAKPDVAFTTIGMTTNGPTVADAQKDNSKTMNALISGLLGLGILEDDIQTQNYNVYPRYTYTDEDGRVQDGYDVSQNVKIKIRQLSTSGEVLSLAGKVGANNVGGLQFMIDDPDFYHEQARDLAISKAKLKAVNLSNSLGVELIRVVGFEEYNNNNAGPYPLRSYAEDAGLGGGTPDVQSGTKDVEVNVRVIFEIR